MAVTYPPGPDPMTMQSKLSAMAADDMPSAACGAGTARDLHAGHDAHELPEQPASEADDPKAQDDGPRVGGHEQRRRGVDAGDREQALEAEHRPVAQQPHAA